MSEDALRKAISDQFRDNWKGTELDRVDWGDNREFDANAKKFVDCDREKEPWCRLAYTQTDTENAEIGESFQRTEGIITVQCFVRINTGEKEINGLIDAAIPVFQNKAFDGVQCFAVGVVKVGQLDYWFQKNAKVNFKFDVFS